MNYTVLIPDTPDNQPMSNDIESDAYHKNTKLDKVAVDMSKMETRLSLTGDLDHDGWLFETNPIWPGEGVLDSSDANGAQEPRGFTSKPWTPLTRKLKIPARILTPYRLLIVARMIVLGLFLAWRVQHPNEDAMWLWRLSVVCEIWFAITWLLDQLPKLCPVNRFTDLIVLKEKFETPSPENPTGKSDLPGVDIFVSTTDPEKEPPLVTANTILSILAADYPVEKLSCYVSDDGGSLLTFEAMAEAASFANIWVPFCRKHGIEPRNPDSFFSSKKDLYKNKLRQGFVKDRRRVKREYDEFKVRINGLPDAICRNSDVFHVKVALKRHMQNVDGVEPKEVAKIPKATWMTDGTQWPGTWTSSAPEHSRGDHAGIIQVMLKPPSEYPLLGTSEDSNVIDVTDVDIRLPFLVYVSREKRPGYDHNKKAGAMNALVRASAIMSNGPFILNLDCDHYIYNSEAIREGMCFMMDRGGDRICYVQFPHRFDVIANNNSVFFDVNMRALNGLQGPVHVGTGCLFRRVALYGFDPPQFEEMSCSDCWNSLYIRLNTDLPQKFGNSRIFVDSIPVAEFEGRPLEDHPSVKNGRQPGALTVGRRHLLDASTVANAVCVISCWYEDKTEWGQRVGWIYGFVDSEDVVTGYRMHNRGWKSVYCVTSRDAFRGTAPIINLTGWVHTRFLRWANGSVEIFFSRDNALFASPKMKLLQRIAYLNVGICPFTSIFLIVYCLLPPLSLFSGQFIVQTLNAAAFLAYLLVITVTLCVLVVLEIKWSGIKLEDWWRNEQFWMIEGTSAHLGAVLQGLLKVVAGIKISFTFTSKSGGDGVDDDEYADLYIVNPTYLPPILIMMLNLIGIAVGINRTLNSTIPQWSRLLGGVFFSFWVLAHLYPFAKGLMGRRRRTPTIAW